MNKNNISCIIHTYNSSAFIEECLKSVLWCNEIIIIDMHSTDNTIEICKKYSAKVFYHENIGYADPARGYGLSKASGSWILSIDSDEIVPKKLSLELIEIAKRNSVDVVKVSFRNFLFGREIIGSGWGYKNQLKICFFKRESVKYTSEVHNFQKVTPGSTILKIINKEMSIVHFNYTDINQFIRKLNSYTDAETNSTKYKYKGWPALKILYHFFREIFGRYIFYRGFRDGWIGLYLSIGMAFYRATAVAKSNTDGEKQIISKYNDIASEMNKNN